MYGVVILHRKDTDYALIIGRINVVFACFLSILSLSFYGFRKFWWLMKRSVFHTNSILLLLLCISVFGSQPNGKSFG